VVLIVISAMLLFKVISWDDILADKPAWNTLAWFATLVALADGLNRTGFVGWFAATIASHLNGFSPTVAMVALLLVSYFGHYMFASSTAHVTAMVPVMLAAASAIPGVNMLQFSLLLAMSMGLMGIITPYGTGPSPVYYGSGYLPSADWWKLGAIFGVIYLVVYLAVGLPWVLFMFP